MSGGEDLREADFEATRSTLSEGLRACRAVVQGYRDLLSDHAGGVAGHPPADNDDLRDLDLN